MLLPRIKYRAGFTFNVGHQSIAPDADGHTSTIIQSLKKQEETSNLGPWACHAVFLMGDITPLECDE